MIDHTPCRLSAFLGAALALLSVSNTSRAATSAIKDGNVVVLQNEQMRVAYDLASGTYSACSRTDKSSNITGACLRIDEFSSDAAGLTRTWESARITDELGTGQKLLIKASGPGKPDLLLEIALYDDRSFLALCGGLKNTLGQSLSVKEINPLHLAKAFDGVSGKADLRMLNGPGGAGLGPRMDGVKQEIGLQTRVHSTTTMECPNNLLATFVSNGQRKSIVVGGLTYHDYAKVASAARVGTDDLVAGIMSWDGAGKQVDPGVSYLPDDRYYLDFLTANPFEALEQYGLAVRAAQKVKLMINDFPTVDGWYVAVFSGGGSEPNNTAGMVAQMDAVVKSGFLRYSKVGIRLIPDDYGANNEQGWWDDAHWQQYGHYVKPYETTRKWGQAITERGGLPFTYCQTGCNSRDFIAAHPDWYLFNDTKRLFDEKGSLTYIKGALDYTDPGFKDHMRKVYENMRDGGLAGLMFDYPENLFRQDRGFEDKNATAAAAYRAIFELPKTVLGANCYIDERNVWAMPNGRSCFSDVTAGVVDSQRVWGDTDFATPEMISRCGHRWYKNRVIFTYDMDSKNLFKVSPNNRDGLRQLLTMVYTVAPRFVLASSFSKMTPEQLHDLSRIYPIHSTPRSARPLDAFTREDGIPHIYDQVIDDVWHQLVFYNPDGAAAGTIGVEIGKDSSFGGMGLKADKSYYVYDFWNDALLGKFPGSGKLEQVLRPGEVRMMSVHEVADHPQFISSNRHVMQGYVDVLKTATLSGTSKVVGGETYKLVIATNGLKPVGGSAQGAKAEVRMNAPETAGIAVLGIDQADNGTVDWAVTF
ncbi:MAG: hypothetical protein NTW21_29580 [Verrucomicrobia bacterium]|nr:hypothetical protein [Verrucomicrobiota bacterium]